MYSEKRDGVPDQGNGPFFSVIIPTFDRAHVVGRAIQSVLDQSFSDFELIVVDDGSHDHTRRVLEQFADVRISYIYQENRGVSAARNVGVQLAKGRHVTFLDSDDEALPEWLESYNQAFQDPNTAIVCSGLRHIWRTGQNIKSKLSLPRESPRFSNHVVLFRSGAFAVQRHLFEAVKGYREGLIYGENSELGVRLVRECRILGLEVASVAKPLVVVHRRASDSAEVRLQAKKRLASVNHMLRYHWDEVPSFQERAFYYKVGGLSAGMLGRYREARHFFAQAILTTPWSWKPYAHFLVTLVPPLAHRLWLRSPTPWEASE